MRGMKRLFQGAATVGSILRGDLVERAADAGLRSLFVGFETLTPPNLVQSNKRQNLGRDYTAVTRRLHDLGIMINGSFVFGMDDDDEDVFKRTVDWPSRRASRRRRFTSRRLTRARGFSPAWNPPDGSSRATGICRHAARRIGRRGCSDALERELLVGVSRVLPVVKSIARVVGARHAETPGEALLLCRGLEKFERLWNAIRAPVAGTDAAARSGLSKVTRGAA